MITAVVLTKNEEDNIAECLRSLKWCDEIIVIDDYSTDKTVHIAQNFSARVYLHSLDNNFSAQRNYGLEKAKGDFVLFVDADERISPGLLSEITSILHQQASFVYENCNGYYMKRKDFIWGKSLKFGETASIKLLRLARKNVGKWQGNVHERWAVKGKTAVLKNPLLHYPHKDITSFLHEINYYTDLVAKDLFTRGKKTNFLSILFYPQIKFLYNYIVLRGYLDEIPGFIVALIMSFHSFLVRGKLWLLWQR